MLRKGLLVVGMTSLVALFMGTPTTVSAQDLSYLELLQRIESLEAELAVQQSQFASFSLVGNEQKDGDDCAVCQKGTDDCECKTRSIYATYELTVLRPYISSNNANILGFTGFSDDYGFGHRFSLGVEGDGGLGVRARYWMYNHGHRVNPAAPLTLNMDLDTFDLEATLSERLWNYDLRFSGGVRYGRAAFGLGVPDFHFEGYGPTVSLQANREIGCRGLYLVGNFRGSMLVGEIRDPFNLIAAPVSGMTDTVDDEITTILESQLGVGWSRELGRTELHVRTLWETQFWLNDLLANDITPAGGFASNLGLMGATSAVELRY